MASHSGFRAGTGAGRMSTLDAIRSHADPHAWWIEGRTRQDHARIVDTMTISGLLAPRSLIVCVLVSPIPGQSMRAPYTRHTAEIVRELERAGLHSAEENPSIYVWKHSAAQTAVSLPSRGMPLCGAE